MYLSITKSVFKGFLYWAHAVCKEKYIKEEKKFLVDMFLENGHKSTFLESLAFFPINIFVQRSKLKSHSHQAPKF